MGDTGMLPLPLVVLPRTLPMPAISSDVIEPWICQLSVGMAGRWMKGAEAVNEVMELGAAMPLKASSFMPVKVPP